MTERELFIAALGQPDLAARAAYLDEACGGDGGLRARIEELLRAHDRPDSLLDAPAPAPSEADPTRTHDGGEPAVDTGLGFLAPPGRPDSFGRIGHYDVLEVLGRGGFGIVFRAFDGVLQRVVAIKVLSPLLAVTSPARKRFLREARSSAAVRHENVVQVHAVEEQPLPYLVMEFIPGETLDRRLNRTGPLGAAEVVRLGRQIAAGLAAAHANGLIHRDVKPANVLVEAGSPERAKLTDFGLARAADDASISQSGVVAGTPLFMSPEQARGESLDHRTDLFSLGSVLYAMTTGRPPFRAEGTVAILKRVAEDTPRPIREVIPETPDWLCRIIEKLHAKNPAERFQTAREVADLLADCERQPAAHDGLTDTSRIPAGRPAPRKRRPWGAMAAALVALALLGAGAVVIGMYGFAGRTDPTGPPHPPAPAPAAARPGGPVNLLARIDPTRDTLQGTWEREGEAVVATSAYAQLQVPDPPPDHYLLVMEAERTGKTGTLNFGLPTAGHTACVTLDYQGVRSGIAGLDGKQLRNSEAIHEGAVLGPGRTTVVAEVRGRRINVRAGGATVFAWEGDPVRLTTIPIWGKTDGQRPYLGVQQGGFVFHRLDLIPLPPPSAPFAEYAAALPAEDRLPAVEAEFRRQATPPAGEIRHTIRDGKVVMLNLEKLRGVADLSPVAALPDLEAIYLPGGTYDLKPLRGLRLRYLDLVCIGEHRVTDLSPLKGMPLQYLRVWGWTGDDLSPLKGMPLRELNVGGGGGKVGDLSSLKGMPLERLYLMVTDAADLSPLAGLWLKMLAVNDTRVTDLTPLKGMPLTSLRTHNTGVSDLLPLAGMPLTDLWISNTKVTDLTPLKGMPLKVLRLDFVPERDAEILRGIKTLETINDEPAADFLKAAGKK